MKNKLNYRKLYTEEDSGKTYLFALIIPVVFGLFLSIIFNSIASALSLEGFAQSPALYSLYLLFVNGSLLVVYFVYNKVCKVDCAKASLVKPKFGWVNLILCCVIALITLFGSLYLINYLTYLMQQIGYNPDSSLPLPLNNGGWLVLNIIILAAVPAFCEELIYRGIILNGLRKFGRVGAVFISALFFALAHGSAMQFFYQFILGLVLAAIVIKTGSIVASMVAHFVNNATVIIFNYISAKSVGPGRENMFSPEIIVISFSVAAIAGLLIWLILKLVKERKKEGETSQNEVYETIYAKESRGFSNARSIMFFATSIVLAVVLWCVGTFV